jgi:hypothetical protein
MLNRLGFNVQFADDPLGRSAEASANAVKIICNTARIDATFASSS